MKPVRIFGRDPALWIGAIAAALQLGGSLGLDGLSGEQVAALNLGIGAVAAIVMAWQVRPIAPAIFTQAVGAIAGVVAAYGYHVSGEQVGAVNVALLAVLTLITRGQVSPTGAREAVAPPAPAPAVVDTPPRSLGIRPPNTPPASRSSGPPFPGNAY